MFRRKKAVEKPTFSHVITLITGDVFETNLDDPHYVASPYNDITTRLLRIKVVRYGYKEESIIDVNPAHITYVLTRENGN